MRYIYFHHVRGRGCARKLVMVAADQQPLPLDVPVPDAVAGDERAAVVEIAALYDNRLGDKGWLTTCIRRSVACPRF